MVLGKDVGLQKVATLSKRGLVDKFMHIIVNRFDHSDWIGKKWKPILGYHLMINLLLRGRLYFDPVTKEDAEKILVTPWLWRFLSLVLKK